MKSLHSTKMITSLIGDKTKNDHVDTQWNILTVMEVERSSHCTICGYKRSCQATLNLCTKFGIDVPNLVLIYDKACKSPL